MSEANKPYQHEPFPVGKTKVDQQRNAALLSGYDYEKYPGGFTGYNGQDLQRVSYEQWQPALRVRVGPRGNYKAGFTRMPDGRLILASCRDNHDTDPDKRRFGIHVYESSDDGESWNEIGKTQLFGKEPSLAVQGDGTLVLTAQGGCFGPSANRNAHTLARSEDGGRTWESIGFEAFDYPRNVIVEPDGSFLFITAVRSDWYNEGHGSPNLLMHRSKDGRTWDRLEGTVDWDFPGFGEVGCLRLKDGRLLAALRRQIPGTTGEGYEDTMITESNDDGKTWACPWRLIETAKVHAYLTELHDGRVLCTYSNYHVPYGVSAVFSKDGGRTWDHDRTIRLSTSNDFYVGWAATLQLPDKRLITSYAVTCYSMQEPDRVTCEVVRWPLSS
jgi:hypothetical protein